MRLFIALNLPDEVCAALTELQRRLRSGGHPVKWVNPASIHLTLQFLGEAEDQRVAELLAALAPVRAAWANSALQLSLEAAGAFPNLRRPQTIWAGVGGDRAGLEQLQRAVIAATEPLGFAPETRPFRAHLTLGRTRRDAGENALRALGAAVAQLPAPSAISWASGLPILYESTLTPQGASYRALT